MAANAHTTAESNQDLTRRDIARIDTSSQEALVTWARKLDTTPLQIIEAVEAVGNHPEDVELHLKGSRSTTNSERVKASQPLQQTED